MFDTVKSTRGREATIGAFHIALVNTECYLAADCLQTTSTQLFEIPTFLNDKTLDWLSFDSKVTKNWRLLGLHMGLSMVTMDTIAYRYRGNIRETVYSALSQAAGGELAVLIEALRQCQCYGAYARLIV